MSGLKDLIEDVRRHQADNAENESKVLVGNTRTGEFETRQWKHVKVGEIVKILDDTQFPADLLLLKSAIKGGIAYVETKSLDGETNLKHKECMKEVAAICINDKETIKLNGSV